MQVAIDYNAGFTGAIARLVDYYGDQKLFSDCTLDLGWDHPNATLVSLYTSALPMQSNPLLMSLLALVQNASQQS